MLNKIITLKGIEKRKTDKSDKSDKSRENMAG